MSLWHDLYPVEEVPASVGEMSMEAWVLRKRGVDIVSLKQRGQICVLMVKSTLDYALTCAAVQHYLVQRFETKYRKVTFGDFILKGELVFEFLDQS